MKAESNIIPNKITIERYEGNADVVLTENIQTITKDEIECYQYDSYRITIIDRPNLDESVEANFDAWLESAKLKEIETVQPPTEAERLIALETAMLEMILGGV